MFIFRILSPFGDGWRQLREGQTWSMRHDTLWFSNKLRGEQKLYLHALRLSFTYRQPRSVHPFALHFLLSLPLLRVHRLRRFGSASIKINKECGEQCAASERTGGQRAEDGAIEIRFERRKSDAQNTFSSSAVRLLGAKEKVFCGKLVRVCCLFVLPLFGRRCVCVRAGSTIFEQELIKAGERIVRYRWWTRSCRNEKRINDCRGNCRLNFHHSVHFDWDAIDGIRLKIK